MRIAFAGTPPFAAAALEALIAAGHTITLVLTQPDRPSGRGMTLKPSAVKEVAVKNALPCISPVSLSEKKGGEEAKTAFRLLLESDSDVLVVAAYGLLLPPAVLDAAKGIGINKEIKSLNIHGSLLPRWRGAAPIQRAIEAGDAKTGISLMKMDAGLDTGPVISVHEVPIETNDTALTLTEKLTRCGAEAIVNALKTPDILTYKAQEENGVTYAAKLLKTESPIDWRLSAKELAQKIHAFNPFPGVTAKKGEETIKIWDAKAVELSGKPGEILVTKKKFIVACGQGALDCIKLQRAGKAAMDAASFAQSFKALPGEFLS